MTAAEAYLIDHFTISYDLTRQAGRIQLEASDLRLALNLHDKFSHGVSQRNTEASLELIKKPRAEIREEKRRNIQFPGHASVKKEWKTHPAMDQVKQLDGCLECQDGIACNPLSRWHRKGRAGDDEDNDTPLGDNGQDVNSVHT